MAAKPTFRRIRRQVASAAMGIITEFVKKSKKSRMSMPRSFTEDQTPKPREEESPTAAMMTAIIRLAFPREMCRPSSKVLTLVSRREMALVSAARRNRRKKGAALFLTYQDF